MIKKSLLYLLSIFCLSVIACKQSEDPFAPMAKKVIENTHLNLTITEAKKIIDLPLHCITIEYPNKLGQVLSKDEELKTPKNLRPIFYGCFDWHSSVHGYWSIVTLLKQFPDLDQDGKIKELLNSLLTNENVEVEMSFFNQPHNKSFERTYGWAWFLKLQQELYSWDSAEAKQWYIILKPIETHIIQNYIAYLQKLQYPIRTGTHDNSAFSLVLAYDYAKEIDNKEFIIAIENFAKEKYITDTNCPLVYEPSGHDFLSPCLQEAWLMSKILPTPTFTKWLEKFLPQLFDPNFKLEVGKVGDRSDGHLVHLDGLNFSRATCLYDISKGIPALKHLNKIASNHFNAAFPNITNDDYMGSHWLGSFALQTLKTQ